MDLRRLSTLQRKTRLRFHFLEHLNRHTNWKKEDEFDVAVDEKLGSTIEGAPKNKRKGAHEDAPGDLKKKCT